MFVVCLVRILDEYTLALLRAQLLVDAALGEQLAGWTQLKMYCDYGSYTVPGFAVVVLVETPSMVHPIMVHKVTWDQGALVGPAGG